ncbi:RtcB family protein, partial [Roseococcus sp. SYP-B2431]|uniref:RtcB family protein n=1 Tax=Roseococcus sp. SYP-B2431 TaxID=2496640 RepID=UPI00197F518E
MEGAPAWVVRKGATPAFPGQRGFVGGSMGDDAVILEGIAGPEAEALLSSTVHGAGVPIRRRPPTTMMLNLPCVCTGVLWSAGKDGGGRRSGNHHRGG